MTSSIRQKLALVPDIAFPVAATIATATVLSWSNPAIAASFNFSFAGNDAYFISGSFSYDDSLYSGTISKEQLSSFNISFTKEGNVEQQYYFGSSSLFDFKFDTDSNSIKSIDAGAFSSISQNFEQVPIGSLSFTLTPKQHTASGCDGLVWRKVSPTSSVSQGGCDSGSDVVVSPSEPDTQTVPEPTSTISLLAVGAFGIVFRLKRSKKVA
jgi:hypothetical protein